MTIEALLWGYSLPEAPRIDSDGNLYFSDGVGRGGVHMMDPAGKVTTLVEGRTLVGGLVLHRDGGFVMAGREIQHWKNGSVRTLLSIEGVHYFNDLHTDMNGAVYVGAIRTNTEELLKKNQGRPWNVIEMEPFITAGECYRINVDGTTELLYEDVRIGNGIGFSPDYRVLYQVDSFAPGIIAHDIDASGKLRRRRLIGQTSFPEGIPDGMAVDSEGTLWVAHVSGGRVVQLSPEGEELSEIKVPATRVNTLTFGGKDLKDVYICAANNLANPERVGTIFRTRSRVPGLRTPLAAV
jgi:sugar lactone lactonase YvrE